VYRPGEGRVGVNSETVNFSKLSFQNLSLPFSPPARGGGNIFLIYQ
jgi:hypothetical protein